MKFLEADTPDAEELVALYNSVGWSAYTDDPNLLALAVANSTYVVTARSDEALVGLARGVSDGVSIFYLQDVLVRPEYQGQGMGRQLIEMSLAKHSHVRQTVLMTDADKHIHDLYRSVGFKSFPTDHGLHGFVKIAGGLV